MGTIVGLWIDHRKAVIVAISELGETTTEVDSGAERQPGRIAGVRSTVPYESQYVRAQALDAMQRHDTEGSYRSAGPFEIPAIQIGWRVYVSEPTVIDLAERIAKAEFGYGPPISGCPECKENA